MRPLCGRVVAGLADVRNDHADAAFAVIRRLYQVDRHLEDQAREGARR